jgi:hypothetical protein
MHTGPLADGQPTIAGTTASKQRARRYNCEAFTQLHEKFTRHRIFNMHKTIPQIKLIGLAGSLRKASFSPATMVGLRNHLPEKVVLDILDLLLPLSITRTTMGPAVLLRYSDFDERSRIAMAS